MRAVDCHGREVLSCIIAWPEFFGIVRVWVCNSWVVVADPWAGLGRPPLRYVYHQSFVYLLSSWVEGIEGVADGLVWP